MKVGGIKAGLLTGREGHRIEVQFPDASLLELELRPLKPLVRFGDRGLSRKGSEPASVSWYWTYTRLQATGNLRYENKDIPVEGLTWMDHEIFTNTDFISTGWNWFACQFDDNTELMVYQLKTKNNTFVTVSEGSYIDKLGNKTPIYFNDQEITPLKFWYWFNNFIW